MNEAALAARDWRKLQERKRAAAEANERFIARFCQPGPIEDPPQGVVFDDPQEGRPHSRRKRRGEE